MATTKPISLLTQKIRDSTEESIPTKKSVPSAYYPKKFAEFGTITKEPNEIKFDKLIHN